MIIDTDVLIWYLRGNLNAKDVVEKNIPFSISAVTYMELLQGMRNKAELQSFKKTMQTWRVNLIHLNSDISARAILYVQDYCLSHSMMMADALIAATAVQNGETLLTANDKHYRFLPNIEIKKLSP